MRVFTHHLLALLADLVPTASKDNDLPGLCAVELHTSRGEFGDEPGRTDLLAGASTDQFVAGHAYVPCDGQLAGPVLVPVEDAKRIVAVFRSAAKNDLHAVEIHHDGGTLRVSEDPNLIDDGLQLRVSLGDLNDFPLGVYRLLTKQDPKKGPDGVVADVSERTDLNGHVLEPFVKVAKRRKLPIRTYIHHQHAAVLLQIGDTYRGIAMPVKPSEDEPTVGGTDVPDADVHAPDLPPEVPEQRDEPAPEPGLFEQADDELVTT